MIGAAGCNLCARPDSIVRRAIARPSLLASLRPRHPPALALLPIIIKGNQPGNELLAPLSVVILGGLLTSTFLNLIIVPAGYAALHRATPTTNQNG